MADPTTGVSSPASTGPNRARARRGAALTVLAALGVVVLLAFAPAAAVTASRMPKPLTSGAARAPRGRAGGRDPHPRRARGPAGRHDDRVGGRRAALRRGGPGAAGRRGRAAPAVERRRVLLLDRTERLPVPVPQRGCRARRGGAGCGSRAAAPPWGLRCSCSRRTRPSTRARRAEPAGSPSPCSTGLRAGGACDPQLDLLALVASDPTVGADDGRPGAHPGPAGLPGRPDTGVADHAADAAPAHAGHDEHRGRRRGPREARPRRGRARRHWSATSRTTRGRSRRSATSS